MPGLTNKALPAGTPDLGARAGTAPNTANGQQTMPPQPTAQELEKIQQKRELDERKRTAARAPMETQIGESGPGALGSSAAMSALATQQDALLKAAGQLGKQGGGIPALGLGMAGMGAGGAAQQDDPNLQQRKEQFLKTAGDSGSKSYLPEGVEVPLSPFELKTGWAIPSQLQTGVNSDLPGQFVARVSENVCDSATGKHLLIPQNTVFSGTYDSQIAYGQERILAVATRMVFPDGSAINLGGMAAADRAGNAGFDADVNNHYAKVFGSAAFMATFSAAVSLTQKQSTGLNGQQSNSQVIAQSLGQQLGQTGSAFIQRGMNVQPTLTRKPGYRFNIMVTKDIVFPGAYKGRACR
jgi:type IV secretion system protein VirB10